MLEVKIPDSEQLDVEMWAAMDSFFVRDDESGQRVGFALGFEAAITFICRENRSVRCFCGNHITQGPEDE